MSAWPPSAQPAAQRPLQATPVTAAAPAPPGPLVEGLLQLPIPRQQQQQQQAPLPFASPPIEKHEVPPGAADEGGDAPPRGSYGSRVSGCCRSFWPKLRLTKDELRWPVQCCAAAGSAAVILALVPVIGSTFAIAAAIGPVCAVVTTDTTAGASLRKSVFVAFCGATGAFLAFGFFAAVDQAAVTEALQAVLLMLSTSLLVLLFSGLRMLGPTYHFATFFGVSSAVTVLFGAYGGALGGQSWDFAWKRCVCVVVGIVMTLIVSQTVMPLRARPHAAESLARIFETLADVLAPLGASLDSDVAQRNAALRRRSLGPAARNDGPPIGSALLLHAAGAVPDHVPAASAARRSTGRVASRAGDFADRFLSAPNVREVAGAAQAGGLRGGVTGTLGDSVNGASGGGGRDGARTDAVQSAVAPTPSNQFLNPQHTHSRRRGSLTVKPRSNHMVRGSGSHHHSHHRHRRHGRHGKRHEERGKHGQCRSCGGRNDRLSPYFHRSTPQYSHLSPYYAGAHSRSRRKSRVNHGGGVGAQNGDAGHPHGTAVDGAFYSRGSAASHSRHNLHTTSLVQIMERGPGAGASSASVIGPEKNPGSPERSSSARRFFKVSFAPGGARSRILDRFRRGTADDVVDAAENCRGTRSELDLMVERYENRQKIVKKLLDSVRDCQGQLRKQDSLADAASQEITFRRPHIFPSKKYKAIVEETTNLYCHIASLVYAYNVYVCTSLLECTAAAEDAASAHSLSGCPGSPERPSWAVSRVHSEIEQLLSSRRGLSAQLHEVSLHQRIHQFTEGEARRRAFSPPPEALRKLTGPRATDAGGGTQTVANVHHASSHGGGAPSSSADPSTSASAAAPPPKDSSSFVDCALEQEEAVIVARLASDFASLLRTFADLVKTHSSDGTDPAARARDQLERIDQHLLELHQRRSQQRTCFAQIMFATLEADVTQQWAPTVAELNWRAAIGISMDQYLAMSDGNRIRFWEAYWLGRDRANASHVRLETLRAVCHRLLDCIELYLRAMRASRPVPAPPELDDIEKL